MARTAVFRLGDLQLKILQVLWDRGAASVAGVHEALAGDARLAYTTVATMLRKMEGRGLVKHRAEDRRFIYRAAVSAEVVTRGMVDDVLERLFEGKLSDMVSHLLTTREVSAAEVRRLEELIAERKRKDGK
jgi:BlaI family penicillinase repressor